MKVLTRSRMPEGDRYFFDCVECRARDGWMQVDTAQDAWYYGIWVNPVERRITNYCEGDVSRETYDTDEEFARAVHELVAWNKDSGYFIGIDGMCREDLIERMKALGLGEYLH